MARYPDRRSAAIPALHAVQDALRLVLAGGHRAGGVRDAPDARLPDGGGDLLRHALHAARRPPRRLRVHEHLVLAVRRRRAVRRLPRARRRRPRASTSAPSSAWARATSRRWSRSTATTSARSRPDEVPDVLDAGAPRRGAAARPPAQAPEVRRPRTPHLAVMTRACLALQGHRRARPAHARRVRAPRRLRGAAQGAGDDARRGPARARGVRPSAGAAAPASRWARRSPSCPRARWTSTSSATPTSPSPAPSRTASSCRSARTCSSRA